MPNVHFFVDDHVDTGLTHHRIISSLDAVGFQERIDGYDYRQSRGAGRYIQLPSFGSCSG